MERATGFRNDRKERTVLFTPREKLSGGDPSDSAQDGTALPAPADSSHDAAAQGGSSAVMQGKTLPAGQGQSGLRDVDLVVIGGGAAGMAAAVSARRNGVQDVLILERNGSLGGVLMQCIHNGFGLHRFGEDLTGVEFAAKYADMVEELGIPCLLNTFVISLSADRTITAVSPGEGLREIRAKSIVLAMGCRERSRSALLIPGARGAGIMTAGTAQRYLNIEGYLPGKRIVIVGSGDIGLIMARQFVLEGCEVAAVVEIMPYSGGLPRNMKQCIEDFGIPVYYSSIIAEVRGKERVSSVLVGKVDGNRRLIPGSEFEISCDTLLISAGLIPENELTESAGITMCPATKGAEVSETLETSIPGVFSCGNVLHVHDLVDYVSEEGEEAGRNAAAWLQNQEKQTSTQRQSQIQSLLQEPGAAQDQSALPARDPAAPGQPSGDIGTSRIPDAAHPDPEDVRASRIPAVPGDGVGGIVPQYVSREAACGEISFMFRPKGRFRDAVITASAGGKELFRRKYPALTPGEMCRIRIPAEKLADAPQILFSIAGTSV